MKYVTMTLALILIVIGSVTFGAYNSEQVIHLINPNASQKIVSVAEKKESTTSEVENSDADVADLDSDTDNPEEFLNEEEQSNGLDLPEVSTDKVSPPTDFKYSKNSADGVKLTLWMNNYTGKTINYYHLKVSAINPVGDPAYDEHTGESDFSINMVGPVKPNEDFGTFGIFTYNPTLTTIKITAIEVKYDDGTTETLPYYYETSDDTGL